MTINFNVCHKNCKICDPSNYFKCSECTNNNYLVDSSGDDIKKCFNLSEINTLFSNYYLYNPPSGNIYKPCSVNCEKCILDSNKCLSCKNSFFFIEGGTNTECATSPNSSEYCLSTNTYILKDESCDGCSPGNNNKKICESCKTDFHFYEINGKKFCFRPEEISHYIGKNYYLDSGDNTYKQCNAKCAICIDTSTKCLECSENYYFYESTDPNDSNDCKPKEEIESMTQKYYLPNGGDKYYKCIDNNCEKCKFTENYCIECKTGYYMIENENKCADSSTIVTFGQNYYFNSADSLYKKCPKSCSKCTSSTVCTECIEPYYLVGQKCITIKDKMENQIYSHYYFSDVDGVKSILECDQSCKTCEEENISCIECNDEYLFYAFDAHGRKKCAPKNQREIDGKHYYYNENLKELRECHKSCVSCKDGKVNNNCYECKRGTTPDPDADYVFIEDPDPNKGNCVLEALFTNKLTNYYSEMIERKLRDNSIINAKIYKKCPEFCKKCDANVKTNPKICKVCNEDKGYYKHTYPSSEAPEECFTDTLVEHKYYTDTGYENSREKCILSSYETERKEMCIKCHNKLGYYSLEHSEETCENEIPIGFYLYNNQIIKKCAYECVSCSEGPKEKSANCDECRVEYPPSAENPKNCIFKCPFYYYEYFGNKYCTGEDECPPSFPYLIPEELKCVEKCPNVAYYGVCYDDCPENTFKYSEIDNICRDNNNQCVLSDFNRIKNHLIDLMKDQTSIIKKVKKYIKNFDYTNKHIDIYKHYLDEYTMYIYQNYQCINELFPEEISVDFSNCGFYLNDIIIVLIVIQREDKYPQVFYQLYTNSLDSNENPILLTNYNCPEVRVEIPADQANFAIEKYKEFYDKGIDLTNYNDNFFHDVCFQYYHNDKDVVIEQRRKEYFQDKYKVCKDGCNFVKPDFNYNRAVCTCNSRNNFLNDLNKTNNDNDNHIMDSSFYNGNDYIFENLKCFVNNFENFFIFRNMGSYAMVFVIVTQTFTIIWYVYNGINSINSFVVDLVRKNPPKRTNKNQELENNNDNNKDNNNDNEGNESISFTTKKSKKRSIKVNDNFISNIDKKTLYKENEDVLIGRTNNFRKKNTQKEIDININLEEKYKNILTNKSQVYTTKNALINDNNNNNIKYENTAYDNYFHVFTDYELNSMELYDAIIKDKRSFCYFLKLQMKLKQEFYKAFCYYEPLYPYSIKTMAYFFNLALNLVVNAMLYTERQIYEGILNKKKYITNIFLRGFFAFLIVECISFVVQCLIKNANYLKSLVYRVKKEKQLRIDAYKSIKNIKINYGLYIFIVIFCEILFWIYLSSYCYSYHGEQLDLLLGFLVTLFFIEIFCIPFAFYLTIFRFVGMKWKLTTCYKMSQAYLDN